LAFAFHFVSLVAFWAILVGPMFIGISMLAGHGFLGEFLQLASPTGIILATFDAFNRLENHKWHSDEPRRTTYIWIHGSIWGFALLLFWPA